VTGIHPPVPHHDGSALHVSPPSPSLGDTVSVRLRIPKSFGTVDKVFVRSVIDAEPRHLPAVLVDEIDGWMWWQAELPLENPVQRYRFLVVAGGVRTWVNNVGATRVEPVDAEDFVLSAYPPAPSWLWSSVIYQVFPDRFARSAAADERVLPEWALGSEWDEEVAQDQPGRSHQLYGGDLDGIVEHLDHLVDLGVNVLYLTPFFPAGSNHRYDASTFDEVDPLLGGNDALVRLVEAAHARGIRVLGDLTTNHSGDRHAWFQAALRHPEAPESAYYYWLDTENTTYVGWLGAATLPKLDWSSPALRRRFVEGDDSVVAHWLKPPYSLDGWRIDVANMTGRFGTDDFNEEVRQTVRETMVEVNPDTVLLAESTNDAAGDFTGDSWHGAMSYPALTKPIWRWLSNDSPVGFSFGIPGGGIGRCTGEEFLEAHLRFSAGYPWPIRLGNLNALDTHDTARFVTNAMPGAMPVAVGLSMTLPGVPMVWAGDEFGLEGIDGEHSRTPIPWGTEPEHGELYRSLIRLRREHHALIAGGVRWIAAEHDVLVYARESAEQTVLCVAARGRFGLRLDSPGIGPGSAAERLFGSASLHAEGTDLRLTGDGPSFTMWAFPGVKVPAHR
jgi:alpha-glucosidase